MKATAVLLLLAVAVAACSADDVVGDHAGQNIDTAAMGVAVEDDSEPAAPPPPTPEEIAAEAAKKELTAYLDWMKRNVDPIEDAEVASKGFMEKLTRYVEVPSTLPNIAALEWPAIKKWSPNHFRAVVGDVTLPTYVNDKDTFWYYNDDQPLDGVEGVDVPDRFDTVNMTVWEIMDAIENPKEDEYVCYSGALANFGPHIIKDVNNLEELGADLASINPNVWFSSAGVTTQLHYDSYFNIFIQLYGSKKFTVVHPNKWELMYPYPKLHPGVSQSQIDFKNLDLEKTPRAKYIDVREVTLNAGDALFLPPYWAHHVTTLEPSISLNVWSDSTTFKRMSRTFSKSIPFDETWTPEQSSIATKVFLEDAVRHIIAGDKVEDFYKTMWTARFSLLHDKDSFDVPAIQAKYCPPDKVAEWREELSQKFAFTMRRINKDWKVIKHRGVKQLYGHNYVEDLVYTIIGDATEVVPFIRACLLPAEFDIPEAPRVLQN